MELESLFATYRDHIYTYVVRQVGVTDAEDLVQEIFMKIYKSINQGSSDEILNVRAWVWRITRNRVIDFARRTRPLTSGYECDIQETIDERPGPFEEARSNELYEAVNQAVASLSEKHRDLYLLRMTAGLSFKEISEITNEPENRLISRMHQALKKIRTSLAKHDYAL